MQTGTIHPDTARGGQTDVFARVHCVCAESRAVLDRARGSPGGREVTMKSHLHPVVLGGNHCCSDETHKIILMSKLATEINSGLFGIKPFGGTATRAIRADG